MQRRKRGRSRRKVYLGSFGVVGRRRGRRKGAFGGGAPPGLDHGDGGEGEGEGDVDVDVDVGEFSLLVSDPNKVLWCGRRERENPGDRERRRREMIEGDQFIKTKTNKLKKLK